jgi:hypothetical protein
MRIATLRAAAVGASLFLAPAALAQVAQSLPYTQDWSNPALITVDDDWSGVPGVIGYRGDDLVPINAETDIQTILVDGSATPQDVNADEISPSTLTSGGISEFQIANPVVGMQGSGTADVPHLVIRVITTGRQNIRVRYNLRDLDANAEDAIQRFALQFRAGTTGDYTNVPAGYVADATTVNTDTQVTPVNAVLPAAADNQASVDIRILTYNALGSDENVGIDDIQITGDPVTASEGAPQGSLSMVVANPVRGAVTVRFSSETAGARLSLSDVLGRQVSTLAEGAAAGSQTAALSAAGLAPGVYVLRLEAGGRVLTQTVSVVR